jgi:hypothetical protein
MERCDPRHARQEQLHMAEHQDLSIIACSNCFTVNRGETFRVLTPRSNIARISMTLRRQQRLAVAFHSHAERVADASFNTHAFAWMQAITIYDGFI